MSTTFALFGIPVNPLIAVGRARLVSQATLEVTQYHIKADIVAQEQERLVVAQTILSDELSATLQNAAKELSPEIAAMVEVQKLILNDPLLVATARGRIAIEYCNAEWALVLSMEHLLEQFQSMDNAYLAERQHDIRQITERLLRHLQGKVVDLTKTLKNDHAPVILVANDLSPAELITIKTTFWQNGYSWAGFVTEMGSKDSHTAILARAEDMPSVVAVPYVRRLIEENEWLIVDGELGAVIVNPDEFTLAKYRNKIANIKANKSSLQSIVKVTTQTIDGFAVQLMANVNSLEEVYVARQSGAEGVGLFRSEFMFIAANKIPDEEEQYGYYKSLLTAMPNKLFTIRTLDIGGDKLLQFPDIQARINHQTEIVSNDQLGLRAIRLCLAYPDIFRTQLRALLRASVYGKLQILLPMITTEFEITDTIALIEECKIELQKEGKAYRDDIPLGIMIEVPATISIINHVANKIQFLSLGSNDLIQYALAVDRSLVNVHYLYNPIHPGILQMIHQIIKLANKNQLPMIVCGELAGNKDWIRILIGLGIQQLSMTVSTLLSVKQQILTSNQRIITQQMKRWKSMNQKLLTNLFDKVNKEL